MGGAGYPGTVIFEERQGSPSGVVARSWFLEARPAARFEKILPTPAVHVIAILSAPYRVYDGSGVGAVVPDVFLSGMQTGHLVIEPPDPIRHVGRGL